MSRRPMTPEDLWALPRVGAPAPLPGGDAFVVPVTRFSVEENRGTTRLHVVRDGAEQAFTSAGESSRQPAVSPDGTRVAFVRDHEKQPQVHVIALDGGEAERVTDLPLGAIDPRWFPDGKRLAFLAPVDLEPPPEGGPPVHVTEDRCYRFWDRWLTDRRRHHLFQLDLATRTVADLTPDWEGWFDPMEPAGNYVIAPDGREIAFGACRTKPPHDPVLWGVFVLPLSARGRPGRPRDITPEPYPRAFTPTYSPDGARILFGVKRDALSWADRTRLALHDRATRRTRILTEKWDLSATDWTYGRRIYCTADQEGRTAIFTLGRRPGVPRRLVRGGTFGRLRVAGGRIWTTLSSLRAPDEVVSFDEEGGDRRRETRFTEPILRTLSLGRPQSVVFEGGGGDPVQMWIVHPASRPKRKPPLVHLIHGGPHGAFGDQWHWRWNAQVFAARGYLAALVNFHGSTGWGQEFTSSIVGRWGDLPYEDVMRATDHLVGKGFVDRKRMAATGGSYGGYLASWIASRTDRFACIVNHAGVCDLQMEFGSDIPQGWHLSAGGDLWSDRDGLDRFSPIRHAEGFQSPMLVLHGEKDYRVPYYQGLLIYNVYKARGLPARLVVYPDENHWILKPKSNLHWYAEFLGWLERWF